MHPFLSVPLRRPRRLRRPLPLPGHHDLRIHPAAPDAIQRNTTTPAAAILRPATAAATAPGILPSGLQRRRRWTVHQPFGYRTMVSFESFT